MEVVFPLYTSQAALPHPSPTFPKLGVSVICSMLPVAESLFLLLSWWAGSMWVWEGSGVFSTSLYFPSEQGSLSLPPQTLASAFLGLSRPQGCLPIPTHTRQGNGELATASDLHSSWQCLATSQKWWQHDGCLPGQGPWGVVQIATEADKEQPNWDLRHPSDTNPGFHFPSVP